MSCSSPMVFSGPCEVTLLLWCHLCQVGCSIPCRFRPKEAIGAPEGTAPLHPGSSIAMVVTCHLLIWTSSRDSRQQGGPLSNLCVCWPLPAASVEGALLVPYVVCTAGPVIKKGTKVRPVWLNG